MNFEPQANQFDQGGIKEDHTTGEFTVTDSSALEALTEREERELAREIAPSIEIAKMELENLRKYIGDREVSQDTQLKISSLLDDSQGLFVDTEKAAFKKILLGVVRNKLKDIYQSLGLDVQDGNSTVN